MKNWNNDRKKLKLIVILANRHRETSIFSSGWPRVIAILCKDLC